MSAESVDVPQPSPDVVRAVADLAVSIDEGLDLARTLVLAYAADELSDEERTAARAAAATIAADERICFLRMLEIQEELTESLWPFAAMRAGQAVACCLVALGREEPEPLAVLSREEVDGLLERHGATDWLATVMSVVREAEAP